MEDWKDGRLEGGKIGRGEGWISRVCCQNARRIWANTPQIAEGAEDAENAERRGFLLTSVRFFVRMHVAFGRVRRKSRISAEDTDFADF